MKEMIREILGTEEKVILNPKEIALLRIDLKELVPKENVAFVELKVGTL